MTFEQAEKIIRLLNYQNVFLAFLVGKCFFDIIYNAILRKVGK